MAKADGSRLLDWLAQRRELDLVPIVLLSGDPESEPHANVVSILREPYGPGDLLQVIHQFFTGPN
jgi:hypothetical protein